LSPCGDGGPGTSWRVGLLALTLTLAGAPAVAAARLDVEGVVVATSPRLEVRVEITNRGDRLAAPLYVVGELGGERREARLASGVAPGERRAVVLDFSAEGHRPGLHALTLLLEHPGEGPPDAAGNPPIVSGRAYLILALGARPTPAVRLSPEPLRLDVRGTLTVRLQSADAAPHRVRLRALTARGLRAEGPEPEIDVPAAGAVEAGLVLVRAGAPHGSGQGVLLVAETLSSALARTAVATATVEVVPHLAWLPRLRRPLLALAVALLASAAAVELVRRRRLSGRRSGLDPGGEGA